MQTLGGGAWHPTCIGREIFFAASGQRGKTTSVCIPTNPRNIKMKTKRLLAPCCLLAALAGTPAGASVISLTSVDWTAGTGGSFTGTSTATGSITASTGNFPNAGTVVSPLGWGSLLGYSISVEEGAYAGVGTNSIVSSSFDFPNSVNQFYLLFKGIANTSFIDLYGSDRTVTFLAGNNATFDSVSEQIFATGSGTFDAIARVVKTSGNWGQGSPLYTFRFDLGNSDPNTPATGLFTLAVAGSPASPSSVPEQGGWTALAILACTAAGIRLRHRLS